MILRNLCNVYLGKHWCPDFIQILRIITWRFININLNEENPLYFSTTEKYDEWKQQIVINNNVAICYLLKKKTVFNVCAMENHSSVFRNVWEGTLDDGSSNTYNKSLLKLKIDFSIPFQLFLPFIPAISQTHVLWARWCALTCCFK